MADRYYEMYCGNYECQSRLNGVTHRVADADLGDDGQVWLCPKCAKQQKEPVNT